MAEEPKRGNIESPESSDPSQPQDETESGRFVTLKAELEKFREQAQNVE